jgi:hypothetical protein
MNDVIQLNTRRLTLEEKLQQKGFTPDGIEWLMEEIQKYCNQAYQNGWEDCEAKEDAE